MRHATTLTRYHAIKCPECNRVPLAMRRDVSWDGHVFIKTFFGVAVACSCEGRRVMQNPPHPVVAEVL